jgi:hypothetical protein
MDTTDIADALAALLLREDVLGDISTICIVKDGATADDIVAVQTFMTQAQAKFLNVLVVLQAAYMETTDEAIWLASVQAAYPSLTGGDSPAVIITAGEEDVVVPAYGTVSRMGASVRYAARLANVPISENPAHPECQTLGRTEFALPGGGSHPIAGTNPVQYRRLYQAEDTLITLHDAGFVTLRVWPQAAGVYLRDSIQYTDEADDYRRVTRQRIANLAARLGYAEGRRFVKSELLPSAGGLIDEGEAQQIERAIDGVLRAKLLGDTRRHLANLQVQVDRNDPSFAQGNVNVTVFMQSRVSVDTFTINLGFSRTA